MAANEVLRRLFPAFIKLHVLHHADQGPVFGVALMRELQRHGYRISAGTLYPTLHELLATGLLRCEARVVNGRRRKYYTATAAGRRVLAQARRKVRELSDEILAEPGRRRRP
ncbi:MAG: PadR family transcriptional regulator [Chloroflexota bacterium]